MPVRIFRVPAFACFDFSSEICFKLKVLLSSDSLTTLKTGIGYYTHNLVTHLHTLPEVSEIGLAGHLSIARYGDSSSEQETEAQPTTAEQPELNIFGKIRQRAERSSLVVSAYHLLAKPAARYRLRKQISTYDVYHSTNFYLPPHYVSRVVTIPDLSTLRFPQFHPRARVNLVNHGIQKALKKSDQVITISNFVRQEILERFSVPEDKITTTLLGADSSFEPVSRTLFENSGQTENLKYGNYFLCASTIEPRKNFARILDAYEVYQKVQRSSALPIVMVGHPGWLSDKLHERIEKMTESGNLRYLGYVDRGTLGLLLGGARALIYPSLYEGFGLPVLEAMQSATAVLTSHNSSMSEIAAHAAYLVNPESTEEIVEGMIKLANDDLLVKQCTDAGLKRSAQFSWRQCAEDTLRVYKKTMQ